MADSHGDEKALAAAIRLLRDKRCATLVHLGDVCDSSLPETADACVDLVRGARVLCVRGNNDHLLLASRHGAAAGLVSEASFDFLEGLSPAREVAGAVMAHSLPFVGRMGLSAMVRDMGDAECALFFSEQPQGLVFRGHSHAPRVVRPGKGGLSRVPLAPGSPVRLLRPAVVTCGALTRGTCLVWEPETGLLLPLALPES
ncbi:MAG: metallophosphoesterase family protein [Deltaproteobacteria bacterium]|nr:metallophosphoesterase family protein [Deltaproteobacteria bacterium]